jgi:hypothetical protein
MNDMFQDVLAHPAVQGGVAPFLVGLLVAGLAWPLRLAGLAPAAGFLAAVYLIGNFALEPLTATRRIVLLGMGAPLLGLLADFAFKPRRGSGVVLGALFGLASLWVFFTVLGQKPLPQALLHGAGVVGLVLVVVAATATLHADPVRAGAAGLGLGVGAGVGALLGASALLGQYGAALGAASGGFVLATMALGRRVAAGTVLTLTASVVAALLGAGAALLAAFPWYAALALALVPAAVRLPLPRNAHAAVQALLASTYSLAAAAAACVLAWMAGRAGH